MVSTPHSWAISPGATTFRLDLDIFTGSPSTSASPVAASRARRSAFAVEHDLAPG